MSVYAIASPTPDGVQIEIALNLESPNKTRGAHWTVKHRQTKRWEAALAGALGQRHLRALEQRPGIKEARVVRVERLVPSRRNFLKDDDNLAFSVKPLNDALTRLGLLADDSRAWLDQEIRQGVSPDGRYWTILSIGRARATAIPVQPATTVTGLVDRAPVIGHKQNTKHRKPEEPGALSPLR